VGNILPFWPRHALDHSRGGFFGEISEDLVVRAEAPRTSVVNTRILWTYATAARLIGPQWRATADWAFDYIVRHFWDGDADGLYWWVDADGRPLATRKQIYAQAFGIYALSEYYRLTGNPKALEMGKALYALIEQHGFDPVHGGYIEARDRTWQPLADMRLSDKDLNSPKSMNTHLHVLEGYTNLLRVWPDETLRARQKALIETMLDHIVDHDTGHFRLFFDQRWQSLSDHVSFGHDIEGSWLLVEAAEVVGDLGLLAQVRTVARKMAQACLDQGVDADGSMLFEADGNGTLVDTTKHWWVQAEAVVGFYNAFEITGEEAFRTASRRAWDYIETHVVDHKHGEWHAKLTRDGVLLHESEDADAVLVGPWKCPYHNARVCYEMLTRLGNEKETP
jgi:mannobiose 2-epimerase